MLGSLFLSAFAAFSCAMGHGETTTLYVSLGVVILGEDEDPDVGRNDTVFPGFRKTSYSYVNFKAIQCVCLSEEQVRHVTRLHTSASTLLRTYVGVV